MVEAIATEFVGDADALIRLDVSEFTGEWATACAENVEVIDSRSNAVQEMEEGAGGPVPWSSGVSSAREGHQTTARGAGQEPGS